MGIVFPKDFYFGTGTSAHQVEGDNTNNDWWQGEQDGRVKYRSGRACDSYNRYEEDFDLAKSINTNAHRFSIEWSRIEPEEGRFDEKEIEHYQKVIDALRARGIEPFVTLHHFTNPIWLAEKGGWNNSKMPEYFSRYVEFVASHIKGVKYWVTINEPMIFGSHGYRIGDWPPFQKNSFWGYGIAVSNMVRAHKIAYRILHRINNEAQVGMAQANNFFDAYHNELASRLFVPIISYIINNWVWDRIGREQDFIGINYYNHNRVHVRLSHYEKWFNQNENKKVTDRGWEIYPEGIYRVVKNAARYKKPLYILENGIADEDDDQRSAYIHDHLMWLHKAMEEGIDVRGYFYWSLLDNFEWETGFTKRFGLVEVNFETFKRRMRPSGKIYGEICRTRSIN
ncbi:MAG: glycoside hydrolase family 1 protein [Candidatus Spechtbacteria bacterium]|nr:glycoside hydrolase family 1 protein [Candidatus Spechtbacteria bacterium]